VIFVTVGTHEDGFDRLIGEMDRLVSTGEVGEEVVYQAGASRLRPARGVVEGMMPFERVQAFMREARVVVTHGGPASIMQVLAYGKVPIVVPRQARFGEHVDDHQVRFAARIADRVVVVLDIADLGPALRAHAERSAVLPRGGSGPERARLFAERLDALCEGLFPPGRRLGGVLRWRR
jgi:UDP-N-acetylglucosamine transferase subunit ALG13